MNRSDRDLEDRKKELQLLQKQLESKMKDLENQMSSSTLLEKEIEIERLERQQREQAAFYSTILSEQDEAKTRKTGQKKPSTLKINRRTSRNRILILVGVLFFIVYLILHAVK